MSDDYEQRLAQWKARHGLTSVGEPTMDDLMAAEDQKSTEEDYCWICGQPFPVSEMVIDADPYLYSDDDQVRDDGWIPSENRVRACTACHAKSEEEEEAL